MRIKRNRHLRVASSLTLLLFLVLSPAQVFAVSPENYFNFEMDRQHGRELQTPLLLRRRRLSGLKTIR